jgi:hypothetical protein
LITSAVIFFIFSGWEYRNYAAGDASAWRAACT